MRIIWFGAWLANLTLVGANPMARKFLAGNRFNLIKENAWYRYPPIRGGSSDPPPRGFGSPPPRIPPDYEPSTQEPPQMPDQYDYQVPPTGGEENTPFEDTFQQKIDSWRQYQMEHAEEQRISLSTRDDQGRLKLFVSLGKGGRAITFFLLMWRDVHLYEVADAKYKGLARYLGVVPLTFLFIANLAGLVASLSSPNHATKKRLKAILNLDKLVEIFLILCYVFKLVFGSSNMVPREIYIASILHSVFFIMQCQATTRFVWNDPLASSQQARSYPSQAGRGLSSQQSAPDSDFQEYQQNPYGY